MMIILQLRKIYTVVFLGIGFFTILGLALEPTLQTAIAHNPGKIEEHCNNHSAAGPGGFCGPSGLESCTIRGGALGVVHFVDIDGDDIHDHTSPGPKGEPQICMKS